MNVYDFDKTIYQGDSTFDFYRFCLKSDLSLLRFFPRQCLAVLLYLLGRISKTCMKERFYTFFRGISDIDALVMSFWKEHSVNIMPWYLAQKSPEDVVISASPTFLLQPVCSQLGIGQLIASQVDKTTGKYLGENCYGEEKVKRYRQIFGDQPIDEFYSDSLSDTPLAEIAKKSYLIKGQTPILWNEYKPSMIAKLKRMFLSGTFLIFLLVGCVNALNGILFSFLFSFLLSANLAFVCGYLISLTISYFLNSIFVFHATFSVKKYIKFFISYLPNFIIQNLCVLLFYNFLGIGELITYALAAIIGIPVTFILMKLFAFAKKND